MTEQSSTDDRKVHDAVQKAIALLMNFDDEARLRVLRTISTFFDLDTAIGNRGNHSGYIVEAARDPGAPSFSDRPELPPKEFLFQKQPKTDLERVACLAYYLSHYRDT